MASSPKVLVVVTSHGQMGGTGKPTGLWLGEVTHFYEPVAQAGYQIDVVSPQGGKPPVDPNSVSSPDTINAAFTADPALAAKLEHTLTPEEVDPDRYVAIYYAGGHGAMWDLVDDRRIAQIAARMHAEGKPVSAVCHGSAALLNIPSENGERLIAGRRVTGFANEEERMIGLTEVVPFLLEDELRARGAQYTKARLPFVSHVVSSGRIVSGQNPQSARDVGTALVTELRGA